MTLPRFSWYNKVINQLKQFSKEETKMAKKENAVTAEPKVKKAAPTGSTLASVQPIGADEVGAPELAKLLGVDPRDFRAFLRTKRDMTTAKGTRYAWKKNSPEMKAIIAEYKAYAKDKPVKVAKPKKVKEEVEEVDTDLEDEVMEEVEVEEVEEIEIDDMDLEI